MPRPRPASAEFARHSHGVSDAGAAAQHGRTTVERAEGGDRDRERVRDGEVAALDGASRGESVACGAQAVGELFDERQRACGSASPARPAGRSAGHPSPRCRRGSPPPPSSRGRSRSTMRGGSPGRAPACRSSRPRAHPGRRARPRRRPVRPPRPSVRVARGSAAGSHPPTAPPQSGRRQAWSPVHASVLLAAPRVAWMGAPPNRCSRRRGASSAGLRPAHRLHLHRRPRAGRERQRSRVRRRDRAPARLGGRGGATLDRRAGDRGVGRSGIRHHHVRRPRTRPDDAPVPERERRGLGDRRIRSAALSRHHIRPHTGGRGLPRQRRRLERRGARSAVADRERAASERRRLHRVGYRPASSRRAPAPCR